MAPIRSGRTGRQERHIPSNATIAASEVRQTRSMTKAALALNSSASTTSFSASPTVFSTSTLTSSSTSTTSASSSPIPATTTTSTLSATVTTSSPNPATEIQTPIPIATPSPSPKANMAIKEKLTGGSFKSLVSSVLNRGSSHGENGSAPGSELFPKTDPAVDGDDCLHDCASCNVAYPRNWRIEETDNLYGQVKGWSTHLVVGTGKTDWVRDVEDEKGSVMEAIGRAAKPGNGRLMLSASNLPTPDNTSDYNDPTTVLLLPAFVLVHNVHPKNVSVLIESVINIAPTSSTPLGPSSIPASLPSPEPNFPDLKIESSPHSVVILMCSQKTRDVRCGQSAPLLKKEFERHLRPLDLYRDSHDERPGGVGIYFISHTGGHKYSANVMVYRRHNAFIGSANGNGDSAAAGQEGVQDVGASQCIWLARVRPEDCENIVRYTVLQGKVVKPESQLRGGFDRAKEAVSW